MRIFIKGGPWKNIEDEILKSAVMKYGKNQWARVASLLPRKSGKQCKARWYEWLDPSIKKTEWTREEEEKLLHLAKIFPSQWRTIAPIVGRTAAQCLEHYEKLLDAAQERDQESAVDDARKLRPGEVDPAPEAKPARPDPIDMDEDEKEMLNEARARLANTKGKKAKRKAREKQLDEARRLASLQKRRELKAAGIYVKAQEKAPARSKRIKNVIDYNQEVPFEKKPVPGFYDTSDEKAHDHATLEFINLSLQRLDGKRKEEEEEQQQKLEAKKQKQKEAKDLPTQIQVINKLNDPLSIHKRSKISLPGPQVSDKELEEIAKLSNSAMEYEMFGDANSATNKLLSDYKQNTPLASAVTARTPIRTPGNVDTVLLEAKNLATMQNMATPLKGGQNTPLPDAFKDFSSHKKSMVTPNPLATLGQTPVLATGAASPASTTGSIFNQKGGSTPLGTPRDELRINVEDAASSIIELDKQRLARHEILLGLRSLPKPATDEYQINARLPQINVEEEHFEIDAADVKAAQDAELRRQELLLLSQRSQAVQRGLPRPALVNTEQPMVDMEGAQNDEQLHALHLLCNELVSLLRYDALMYPVNEKTKRKVRPLFEQFELEQLEKARRLIDSELEDMVDSFPSAEEFSVAWNKCMSESFVDNNRNLVSLIAMKNQSQHVLQALQEKYEQLKKQFEEEKQKSSKLETKATVLTKGFVVRAQNTHRTIAEICKQIEQDKFHLSSYSTLLDMERLAITQRESKLSEEVQQVKERESALHERYSQLTTEKQKYERMLQNKLQ